MASAGWAPTPTPHDKVAPGFHIPYEVKDTAYGKGLFATIDIPAGTLLWKCTMGKNGEPGINVYSFKNEEEARARLAQLTPADAAYWMDHVYMFEGKLNEILDDGKLWNHSEAPNTGLAPSSGPEYDWESTYSIRDIKAGEELLDDYGKIVCWRPCRCLRRLAIASIALALSCLQACTSTRRGTRRSAASSASIVPSSPRSPSRRRSRIVDGYGDVTSPVYRPGAFFGLLVLLASMSSRAASLCSKRVTCTSR